MAKLRSRAVAYLELVRATNCFIVAASVCVGGLLARATEWGMVILASISALLIAGGGYSINDYFDREIDSVNRPRRPIPSGRIERRNAVYLSLVLFCVGIALSVVVGPTGVITAIVASVLLYLYSLTFKRRGLTGNLLVSGLTGLAFFYGALAGGKALGGVIPFAFAFLFHLGREVLKDTEDFKGDEAVGARTIPLRWGKSFALNFASGIFLFLILITPIPYVLGIYHFFYLITVLVGVDLVLVFLLLWLRRGVMEERLGRVNQLLKADMLVGLFALYLGRFW